MSDTPDNVDDLESTVLSSRTQAGAEYIDDADDTVIVSRPSAQQAEAPVFSAPPVPPLPPVPTDTDDAGFEYTVIGSRRAEQDVAYTEVDEHTVLGSRQATVADTQFDVDEHTVLSARHAGESADLDEVDEHTVLGSRQLEDLDNTVLGSRATQVPDETVISARRGVDDETVIGGRRAAQPSDRTHVVPRRRTVQPPVDVSGGPRSATQPDTRILKEPYRPRGAAPAPVFRTQEMPKPLQQTADSVRAAHQQRKRAKRSLVTITIVGTLIVGAAIAGVVLLLMPMLAG